jgi:hypothetical protein
MRNLARTLALTVAIGTGAMLAHADEMADGGPDGPTTARQGMHACPIGFYMTGIHVANNILLCNNIPPPYQASDEVVDSSTVWNGMHTCPDGKVMTGFHEGRNLLLCVPGPSHSGQIPSGLLLDVQTQRRNMHACPWGLPMAGIHVANNWLACEYRYW